MEGIYKTEFWKGLVLFEKKQTTNTCWGCNFMKDCGQSRRYVEKCTDRTIKLNVKKAPAEFLGSGRF